MKYYETHFEDYIQSSKLNNLHPENEDIINQFPSHIDNFKNLIIYGPSGIGKYTQSLNIIQNDTFYDILNISNSINEVFTIINNGNIGIGIAEPSNKLDVKGNINIDSYGNNYKYTIDGRDIILDTSNYI